MGYIHMPWARDLPGLNVNEKMVLFILTLRAGNATRQTFMSVGLIAREGGFSPSSKNTVRRALNGLRDKGHIDWKGRVREGTSEQSSNIYTVHWDKVGAESTHVGADSTQVGAESTTNKELNRSTNKSIDSPSSNDEAHVAPAIPGNRSSTEKAANADPIGPAFYASEDRGVLINNVQSLAGRTEDSIQMEQFANNLTTAFNDDDGLDFLIYERGWAPPYKCSERYEAAKWLNTFLHAWQLEAGPLTWRGQS